MKSLNDHVNEYKKQIRKGDISEAYRGIIEYILSLRTYFKNKYPDYSVSGNVYLGYMDMTYFSLFPESLKSKKLKIAIVFIHEKVKFEIWLAGVNKQVQKKYWTMFKESGFDKYRMPSDIKGFDSIVEHDLVNEPDFDNQVALTKQIEKGTLKFIKDITSFLDK